MRPEDHKDDKIIILARIYDSRGRLTGARLADEDHIHLSPQATSLIEAALARAGWTQLHLHSSFEAHEPTKVRYSVFFCPDFWGRSRSSLDRGAGLVSLDDLKDDRILIVTRFYDSQGGLTGIRFADDDRIHLTPQAASLIERSLARTGWTQLERHSEVENRGSTQTRYSVYYCPDFLGRIASPIERKADGTLSARARLC